ncbi:unnamed protein product, partial [Symbiodinium necroappetens]
ASSSSKISDHGEQSRSRSKQHCLSSLRSFLQNPPENVRVDADSLICEVDQVRILFSVPEAADWFQTCDLPWFLMDFTMKTNAPGLVLGAIGPIGLKRLPNGTPHLRFVPVQYMLSHVEDQEAHGLLMQKYVAMAESAGIELTDGIFDCACYAGAKENMKEAAKKRDEASGDPIIATAFARLTGGKYRADLFFRDEIWPGNCSRHGLQEPATLMLDVCLVLRSRLNAGVYSDMCHVLDEPWRALQTGAKTTWAARSVEQDGDEEQRSKRLSLDDILKHFRKHGARGTFLASVTSRVLSDGRQARLLYVLPKYRLELGINGHRGRPEAWFGHHCPTGSRGVCGPRDRPT